MATLDFAFLAEYAKVEPNATITAVGAGLRGVGVPEIEGEFYVYIAGGVDRDRDEGSATLTITVEAPDGLYTVGQTAIMEPPAATGPFATTVFAFAMNVPVVALGKHKVILELNEQTVETIDFWVAIPPSVTTAGD